MKWFTRDNGRVMFYPNCECSYVGRDFCYNCVITSDPVEKRQREEKEPHKPVWWKKYMKTRLNEWDLFFLTGVSPTKTVGWRPYQGRKK